MKPSEIDKFLDVALEAALASSDIIMNSLDVPKLKNYKGPADLVTKTDHHSEKVIKTIISSNFPNHSILAEESGQEINNSDYLWIIDPLDGTTNFYHGYPSFSVSIALYHLNKPVLGIVLEMPNLKMYSGIVGKGAFCEGKAIQCSKTEFLDESLLITGFAYKHDEIWAKNMELFKYFTSATHGVRRLGAASVDICHVASGKADGYWEFRLKPWDTAAAIIIAKEAGAIISQVNGEEYNIYENNILVANPKIYDQMKKSIISYSN